MVARGALLGILALLTTTPAAAQQWRTMDVSRQLRDSAAHEVHIRYGAGTLAIRPTEEPVLFTMHLRYDEEAVTPVHRYDADARQLSLGFSDASLRIGRSTGRRSEGEMRVALSRHVPMDLHLEMGAAQARLDLGGLALRTLKVETGASESRIAFGARNPVVLRQLDINAGAASLELTGLGYANVERIQVKGGVGSVVMDFAGGVTRDVGVTAEMALGRVELRVPHDVGVRVELSRFLAGFDHPGFEKRDGAWYSDNWDRAAHRLTLNVKTVFGSVGIVRGD